VAKKPRTPAPPRVQAPQRRDQPKKPGAPRNWKLLGIGAAVVAIALGVGLGIAFSGGNSGGSSAPNTVNFAKLPDLHEGPPPWDNGSGFLEERLPFLNLDLLGAEGQVLHVHQHLDLYVNGKHVSVPAGIGITLDRTAITQVHTHDTSGVIHVESPTRRSFTLGEFFGEWGVWVSANRVGDEHGKVNWWLNGKKQTGNPANLDLKAHQVIVIAIGKRPPTIRKTYQWNGL
jgi:hypothetical protein